MVDNSEPALGPDELAAKLAEVYTVVGPLYRRVLREVERRSGDNGVSVGVRAVLERLMTTESETVSSIARAAALSRQFVQRNVNEARERGFVALRENPAHRRSPLVELTESGRVAISAVQHGEHETMRHVGGDLTRAELDSTLRVLRQMLGGLNHVNIDGDR